MCTTRKYIDSFAFYIHIFNSHINLRKKKRFCKSVKKLFKYVMATNKQKDTGITEYVSH